MKLLQPLVMAAITLSLSACIISPDNNHRRNSDPGYSHHHSDSGSHGNVDPGYSRPANSHHNNNNHGNMDPGYGHQSSNTLRPGETIYSRNNPDPGFSR